ncbi:MAG: TRAM domain-containing protein [Methanomassiliicoccales archaeon]
MKIEDIGRQGDGIARISGVIVFVPGPKVGDEMEITMSRLCEAPPSPRMLRNR